MGTPRRYQVIKSSGRPIKAWVNGVPMEEGAKEQLRNVASLPFIHRWVAAMPDVHVGMGATIGSVIATRGAVIPAAVGVDIGCGMMAVRTTLEASDLPEDLASVRAAIEAAVPHGRTANGGPGDVGAWADIPPEPARVWQGLAPRFDRIVKKHPKLARANTVNHLGTLGTGNHFIEMCLDAADRVWVMLHSGSRGIGGRIGSYFIQLAKDEVRRRRVCVPDLNLAYFEEGSASFDEYLEAAAWAQAFAAANRQLMLRAVLHALDVHAALPAFVATDESVNCHHNYVARERHYGEDVLVTRKGAVRARAGDLGIIPGSMGARSYIVRGRGEPESFYSCSHGAGRTMTRTAARKRFSVADHARATAGIECRKDRDVLDETPMAYKDIDAVMAAQEDLVEIVHTLRQVLCVKG